MVVIKELYMSKIELLLEELEIELKKKCKDKHPKSMGFSDIESVIYRFWLRKEEWE